MFQLRLKESEREKTAGCYKWEKLKRNFKTCMRKTERTGEQTWS